MLVVADKSNVAFGGSFADSINYAAAIKHSFVHTYIQTHICREFPSWLACKVVNKL